MAIYAWVDQIFEADAVATGGVVRRKLADVLKYGSIEDLEQEVRRRGFHLILNGEQVIVICNQGDIRIIC
jgi:predicted PolB exonuclease-like 3'-5' exonuclease